MRMGKPIALANLTFGTMLLRQVGIDALAVFNESENKIGEAQSNSAVTLVGGLKDCGYHNIGYVNVSETSCAYS